MGQHFDTIPDDIVEWILKQKLFWVATAPLSGSGNVNVSPKGVDGTFHIVNNHQVWYEDLTGSGVETISHVRENGRITFMFSAFDGPPRITRLWGTATVYEFDSPEYNALLPLEKREPGSRAIIMAEIHKVGTSCGFAVPFFDFKAPRVKLARIAVMCETNDIKYEDACRQLTSIPSSDGAHSTAISISGATAAPLELPDPPKMSLKGFWRGLNQKSIDGLPGMLTAFNSATTFDRSVLDQKYAFHEKGDDEESASKGAPGRKRAVDPADIKLMIAFMLGILVTALWVHRRAVIEHGPFGFLW